jgi:Thymidylate synthase
MQVSVIRADSIDRRRIATRRARDFTGRAELGGTIVVTKNARAPLGHAGAATAAVTAPTLGAAWLDALRAIVADGAPGVYDGREILELGLLDLIVERPAPADELIERYGDAERLAWMHANFTDETAVEELGGADSYATRLFDYEHSGHNQIAWVIERLHSDPGSRSAIVTTLQPRSDSTYVPCVSLLHFWQPGTGVELVVTAHSIDFGTKGYANLVELAALQQRVADELGTSAGRLVLRVTSSHVYANDLPLVHEILAGAPPD